MRKVKGDIMKIYVVGDYGAEHNLIRSVHKTYDSALKAWNKIRKYLLQQAKLSVSKNNEDSYMYERMVKNLSHTNPKKNNNSPHETPYIKEYNVEE